MSAIASAWAAAARRATRPRTSCAAASTFSTRRDDVDASSAPARRPPAAAAPRTRRCVHTGAGASTATAASAQSSSSAASEPSGFAPSTRRVRGFSWRSTALTGDGTVSRSSRRMPGAHRGVLLGRRREHPHVDRAARVDERREAAHGVAAADAFDGARQLVEVVGPGAQPASFQLAGDRFARRPAGPARRVAPAAPRGPCRARPRCRPRTRRRTSPAGATGSLSRSKASIGTSTPVRRLQRRAAATRSSGSVPGSRVASTARAVSGAGTKLRRRSFGSERISAVTSSSRSAGTCQANSSPPRRASTSTGTCTVTPSSSAPGSNR